MGGESGVRTFVSDEISETSWVPRSTQQPRQLTALAGAAWETDVTDIIITTGHNQRGGRHRAASSSQESPITNRLRVCYRATSPFSAAASNLFCSSAYLSLR